MERERRTSDNLDSSMATEDVEAKPTIATPEMHVLLPTVSTTEKAASAAAPTGKKHWTKKTVVPFVVMTVVQFLYAGHQILSKVALSTGIDPLFLSVFRNFVGFLFLGPPAYFLERDVRPKMTLSTFGSLNFLAFFGILGSQQMFLVGLKLTTPLFAAVAQNTIPVITFLLAVLTGTEKISFRKMYDYARMFGTLVCISGAVTMTLYKGMAIYTKPIDGPDKSHRSVFHMGMVTPILDHLHLKISHGSLGVFSLLANCTSWALYLINQGTVLQKYPALLSMGAMMQLLGSIQVAIFGVTFEGFRCLDLRQLTMDHFVIILYVGIVASGINLVLQAWCIQQLGPFIISLYSPIQSLVVSFLAILVLGETLYMGILIGGTLIIGGFYIVIYGQRMKRHSIRNAILRRTQIPGLGDRKQSDVEEPLLS